MLGSEPAGTADYARSHPALMDEKTGLANRLHFDLVYNYLFEAGDRGLPFTIMLVSTGSEGSMGDEEIRALGKAIQKTTRTSDLVSHVGSGRYVVLLIGTNLQGGRIAADRVDLAISGIAPGKISFGLAAYSEDVQNSAELLKAADTALRAAEGAGGGVELA